jgi:hypothetical protein
MAKAKATKASDNGKAAASDSGVDPKVEKAANEIRRQGGTAAIICHTLDIPYSQAVALANAYDKRVGHEPKEIVRLADGVKLAGYAVKDGRNPKAVKKAAAGKAKATPAKTVAKPADKPVHPAQP